MTRRRAIGVGVLGLLVAAGGAAVYLERWSPEVVPARRLHPNVLLITLDTTRADRLGSYGHAAAVTPNLDRIAASGVRFAQAVSPAPLTLPAHASLMTGRNPYRHGVRNNGYFVLGADVPTLAERFAAAGYDTAAFVSAFVLDRQFGLARGFATYDDALDAPREAADPLELERRGDRTARAASAWLAAHDATRPYFLWVHLYDAHEPYAPPAPYRTSFDGRLYDGEIAFQDAMVGELLAAAGRASGRAGAALMVVAGDHGESLGDHGESTHGLFVYESAVRVPLLVSWPGVLPPRVVDPVVALADVAPTVAALTGLPVFDGIDGQSLLPLMEGAAPGRAGPVYAETLFPQFFMGWAPLRSVRDGRWKFIDAPEPELYDLAADPEEQSNRWADEPAMARTLKQQLESMARAPAVAATTPLSADAQRKLAALGYVSRPTAADAVTGPRPDPKRMAPLFERLLAGNRALAAGRPAAAAAEARAVLGDDPDNAFARLVLGRALLASGDLAGAVAAFRAYLAEVPASADAHHWLALALLRQGDRAGALAEDDAAIALDPRHASAIALRAGLLFSSGRRDEGLAALKAAVEAQPAHAALRVDYADLLADAGQGDAADAEYGRALAARPDDVRALIGLGQLQSRQNRLEPALATLTRVLDLDPRHEEARIERAAVYSRLGRRAEARADLQRLIGADVRPDVRRAAERGLRELREPRP